MYEVGIRWENDRKQIEASSSTAAKRKYCQMTGRNYNDPRCGGSILVARKIEPRKCASNQHKVV